MDEYELDVSENLWALVINHLYRELLELVFTSLFYLFIFKLHLNSENRRKFWLNGEVEST